MFIKNKFKKLVFLLVVFLMFFSFSSVITYSIEPVGPPPQIDKIFSQVFDNLIYFFSGQWIYNGTRLVAFFRFIFFIILFTIYYLVLEEVVLKNMSISDERKKKTSLVLAISFSLISVLAVPLQVYVEAFRNYGFITQLIIWIPWSLVLGGAIYYTFKVVNTSNPGIFLTPAMLYLARGVLLIALAYTIWTLMYAFDPAATALKGLGNPTINPPKYPNNLPKTFPGQVSV